MTACFSKAFMAAGFLLLAMSGAKAQQQAAPAATTQTFQSWILTCVEREAAKACEMNQNIADPNGRPLMQLQIGRFNTQAGDRIMLARFPVDVSAGYPIVWSAGETSIVLTLRTCLANFCAAGGRISQDVVTALLRADPNTETRFTMTRADGSAVSVPLSLTGFSEAWKAMVERSE